MVRVGAMVVGDLENEGGGEGNGESRGDGGGRFRERGWWRG